MTVEAASPALIEKIRTSVTDSQGQYIIVNTLTGPMAASPGNNFALAAGTSLQR